MLGRLFLPEHLSLICLGRAALRCADVGESAATWVDTFSEIEAGSSRAYRSLLLAPSPPASSTEFRPLPRGLPEKEPDSGCIHLAADWLSSWPAGSPAS